MTRFLLAAALAVPLLSAAPAFAEVQGAWVATDRTVDCSSYDTIRRDLLKPDMTDEQKALALYDFFRQRVYHYKNLPETREPLKTVNIIGNTLCGSQATCMKGLLQEVAGLKTRVVSHPGHTFYEVYYDGKWHGFDTMTNFYVFTRGKGKDRYVASFAELNKDPSLIKEAVKEGRSVTALCPCGDDPLAFADKIQITDYEPERSDWSIKDYSLRQGEELVRSWWPHGKPLPGSFDGGRPGPVHTCGTRDRQAEPELFQFWEPYGIPKFAPSTSVSYRHYANGWIAYSPDLTNAHAVSDGGAKLEGVQATKNGLAGQGTWEYRVKSPYHITSAELSLDVDLASADSAVTVEVTDARGQWQPVPLEGLAKVQTLSLDKHVVRANRGRYEYGVRIRLEGHHTALRRQHLKTWFQHNAMAAPHLMPGKNRVTVEVAEEAGLKAAPLTVVYRYKDAPKWDGAVKSVEQTVTKNGQSFDVALPETDKLPQMQDLTIRYGALAWRPEPVKQGE
ncbi:MAG: hypothetical protein WED34_18655 [Planctomycetales bacterium]